MVCGLRICVMDPRISRSSLLDLPNEVLLKIIEEETRHKDFENLTLCCKELYTLAARARAKHLQTKRKFATFIVGDLHLYNGLEEPVVPREVHPVFALQELLAHQDVAVEYCRTLKLGGVTSAGYVTGQYDADVTDEAFTITQKLAPQLKALTEQEPFADTDEWFERQLEGVCCLPYAVPLTFLHNITALELVNCSELLQGLDDHVWNDHNVFSGLQTSHHSLQEVRLLGTHDEGAEFEVLASFTDIPSVRRLYGLHVVANSKKIEEGDFPYTRFHGITEIHIECSSIGSPYFARLLGSIGALEDFYYEHNQSIDDQAPCSGRKIICALQQHARETLQTLTYLDSSQESRGKESYMCYRTSLQDFLVLRHVAIEYPILKHEHGVWCDEVSMRMYKLVDVMPRTLETLELFGPMSDIEVALLFSGLRERREERLPKLRKISMKRDLNLDQEVQDDCKELGIELATVDQPKKKYPHEDY